MTMTPILARKMSVDELSDHEGHAEMLRVFDIATKSLDALEGLDESEYVPLAFAGTIMALIQKAIFLATLECALTKNQNDPRPHFEELVSNLWDDWEGPREAAE
jgi:hypothetical protein